MLHGSGNKPCARCDAEMVQQVQRMLHASLQVYGADKVWLQLNREGIIVARCTGERLMRLQGLQGVRRGKAQRTTIVDLKALVPLDLGNLQFRAEHPNQLWAPDFTCVSVLQGWVYVVFVIDVFSRRIVGWRQSSSMRTAFVLDALEQALYDRKPLEEDGLIHHSNRGSQYLSIRYSEQLAEAGIESSVASRVKPPWPRPSTASTRRRSFTDAGHGGPSRPLS